MIQRQSKVMLRSLALKEPGGLLEPRLYSYIEAERQAYSLSLIFPSFTLTNRGRRMAYAVALSCVSILSLAHATSSKMGISEEAALPTAHDAQMPNAILTDLEGQNMTTAFSFPARPVVQNAFFGMPRPEPQRPSQMYYMIGGYPSTMNNMYGSANVTLAGYTAP